MRKGDLDVWEVVVVMRGGEGRGEGGLRGGKKKAKEGFLKVI